MQYRRFGRTELQMPVFSCGGMRYQYKRHNYPAWRIPKDNQRNLEATIRRSIEVGINHIETARGFGTSEMQLGRILPTLPREQLIVQTKIAPNSNPKQFRREFDKSLAFLKLDYVDLLGLHGINTPELLHDSIRPGGCLDVARKLQDQGKVRFIGFSTHRPTDVIVKTIETKQYNYKNQHKNNKKQTNKPTKETTTQHEKDDFIIS